MQTPSPPNPYQTAAAQTQSNVQSAVANAYLNNYTDITPFGTANYDQTGTEYITDAKGKQVAVPTFTRTVELDPAQQAILDRQNQASIQLGDLANSQLSFLQDYLGKPYNVEEALGPRQQNDWSEDRSRVEDAIMSRYNRHYGEYTDSLDAKLRAQGLTPGSEAWNRQYSKAGEMYNDATMQAILAGGSEQSRLANLYNQDRAAALTEAFAGRNQPINEVTSLLSGQQLNVPQFSSPYQTGIQPAPIADLINQNYAQQVSNANGQAAGLFGLLGAGASLLSDRRMKMDIRHVGFLPNGIRIYKYRMKGDPHRIHRGVMADEVKKVLPKAIGNLLGFMTVDYGKVLNAC